MTETKNPDLSDLDDLLDCARYFVHDRIDAMEDDVEACLFDPARPATFSALLYCFSTVDLLGALAGGRADEGAPTTDQARDYMETFMRYGDDEVRLLQAQFRHKIVHLAQPKPVVSSQGRFVAWMLHHDDEDEHLKLETLAPNAWGEVGASMGPKWKFTCTHRFHPTFPRITTGFSGN
jgi:hypothetical protein